MASPPRMPVAVSCFDKASYRTVTADAVVRTRTLPADVAVLASWTWIVRAVGRANSSDTRASTITNIVDSDSAATSTPTSRCSSMLTTNASAAAGVCGRAVNSGSFGEQARMGSHLAAWSETGRRMAAARLPPSQSQTRLATAHAAQSPQASLPPPADDSLQ